MKKLLFSAFCILASVSCLLTSAPAQVYSTTFYSLTNFPATLAAGTAVVTSNIIPLTKNCGFALQGSVASSSGANSTLVLGSFTADNTNYASLKWVWVIPTFGPTNQVANTNWSPAQLAGYTAVNITTISNATAGTLTIGGFLVNRVSYNSGN